jgi:hypothetical protein
LHLNLDLGIGTREPVQTSQDGGGVVFVMVVEEPTRRFRKLGHHDEDNNGENTLESDWESPGEVVRTIGTSIVDPVGDERANGNHAAFDTDDLSTVLGLAASELLLATDQVVAVVIA